MNKYYWMLMIGSLILGLSAGALYGNRLAATNDIKMPLESQPAPAAENPPAPSLKPSGIPKSLTDNPNVHCEFFDRGISAVVDDPIDYDLDPETDVRVYVVLCDGYNQPVTTPLSDLSQGVPGKSLKPAPSLE